MQDREHLIEKAQKQLSSAFRRFDSDNSGYLQKNEFISFLKRIVSAFGAQDPSIQQAEQIWKEIDLNGDGKLSKIEFDALIVDIVDVICEDKRRSRKLITGEVVFSN